MTEGKRKSSRAHAVAQAAMVWAMIDESTGEDNLAEFVETGALEATPESLPYNPAVMAQIAKNWEQ